MFLSRSLSVSLSLSLSLMEVNDLWFIFWIKLQVTAEVQGLEKCIFLLSNKLQFLR